MAHLYAKAPPAFAHDPWAWDYTRDRIEANTGIPYDQWQGKHFAGAAAMYKNVVKKYGDSVQSGTMVAPRECVDCGQVNPHYAGDYVCRVCRDAIEAAPTFEAASQTITNPGGLDAIREALYESLGHAEKDRKAGKVVWTREALSVPAEASQASHVAPTEPEPVPSVTRNYGAMGEAKLRTEAAKLEQGILPSRYAERGENAEDHYEAALRAAAEKGIAL